VETPRILLIDIITSLSTGLSDELTRVGLRVFAAKPESRVNEIAQLSPDLVLLGPSLDRETCLKCMYKVKIADRLVPILILHKGTQPPDSYSQYLPGVHCVGLSQMQEEVSRIVTENLEDRSNGISEYPLIVGQSEKIREVRQKITNVGGKNITVLITGETGTGKELVARFIHYHSPRREGPLVKISCGALPDDLLESEIFGFQKGAFTGAYRDKPGRLELAQGGTLFIDEIGELSLTLQVKFLQLLEDKAFARLGGVRDEVIDIRTVAATNADLAKKVRLGQFRKDLFYRLNVVNIRVPPLRERKEDIGWLTFYFLNKYSFEQKRELLDIPDKISQHFQDYHWAGNVRELENVVRRAVALRDWGFVFRELQMDATPQAESQYPPSVEHSFERRDQSMKEALSQEDFSLKKITKAYVLEAEKKAILSALEKTHWNRKVAAQNLKVSYKTLLNRIDELGLKPV
jgi:two-component system, NtrC family, response regulator AtoC